MESGSSKADTVREHGSPRFNTTRWTVVVSAQGKDNEAQQLESLELLCRQYWYPLYYFARRRGHVPHDAQDLVQGFFAKLLEKSYLDSADAAKGRFRTFMLTAFSNYMSDDRRKVEARKRGGNVVFIELDELQAMDRYDLEPNDDHTPDVAFALRWAETILESAVARLRDEMDGSGKIARFEALKPYLLQTKESTYEQTAAALEMSVASVKSAIYRMRQRFHIIFRHEISQTLTSENDIDDEIRYLLGLLSSK